MVITSLHGWILPVCLDLTSPLFLASSFWRHIIYHLVWTNCLTALDHCSNMSSGPLGIYNQMVSYLPPTGGEFLLSMYNSIWPENSVSVAWGEAVVIHVLKQGKNCSVTSYTPVSLTSCSKTMVCILNHQLVCPMENRNIFI